MALAALKGDARVAAGDGAPRLFTLLVGSMARRRTPSSRTPEPTRSIEAPGLGAVPVARPGGADLPSRSIAQGIEAPHLRLVLGGRVGADDGAHARCDQARETGLSITQRGDGP